MTAVTKKRFERGHLRKCGGKANGAFGGRSASIGPFLPVASPVFVEPPYCLGHHHLAPRPMRGFFFAMARTYLVFADIEGKLDVSYLAFKSPRAGFPCGNRRGRDSKPAPDAGLFFYWNPT